MSDKIKEITILPFPNNIIPFFQWSRPREISYKTITKVNTFFVLDTLTQLEKQYLYTILEVTT